MKQEIKFRTGHCPDCLGVHSAHVILNPDYPTIEKIDEFYGNGGEYECMEFVSPEEYERVKSEKLLIEKIYTFHEYEQAWVHFCICETVHNKVKTFSEACSVLGIPDSIPDFGSIPADLKLQIEAHYQLAIISRVLNDGKKVDWDFTDRSRFDTDSFYPVEFDQEKEIPILGFGIYGHLEEPERSPGILCYLLEDGTAQWAGVHFRDLYIQYYQKPQHHLKPNK